MKKIQVQRKKGGMKISHCKRKAYVVNILMDNDESQVTMTLIFHWMPLRILLLNIIVYIIKKLLPY